MNQNANLNSQYINNKKSRKTKKKNKTLTCREYKEWVVPFLQEELDEKRVMELIRHIEKCSDCKEEVRIQYLVREGLNRLENGRNFDFTRDFKAKLEREKRNNSKIIHLQSFIYVVAILTVVCSMGMLLVNLIL